MSLKLFIFMGIFLLDILFFFCYFGINLRYLIHLRRECLSDKCFSQDPQTDSAVSMCSSDNEYSKDKDKHSEDKEKDKKKRRGRRILDKTLKERRSSKTLTEQDIKHIERHLSMKRIIR